MIREFDDENEISSIVRRGTSPLVSGKNKLFSKFWLNTELIQQLLVFVAIFQLSDRSLKVTVDRYSIASLLITLGMFSRSM